MKKFFLIAVILIAPIISLARIENVGIIKGIWFSKTQFFDGDTIRIYTALQNNSGADVEGEIAFFDNDRLIGKKSFSALNARIIESWIDTRVYSGEHIFSVKINKIAKSTPGDITPIQAESITSDRIVVVKLDTDGDGIANDSDDDDDGDGYLDDEEKEAGSDPLNSKSIPKKEEPQQQNNTTQQTILPRQEEDKSQEELLEQSPEIIQKLAEKNDVVKSLVVRVSDLQNRSRDFVKRERIKIENLKKDYDAQKVSEKNNIITQKIKKQTNSNTHTIFSYLQSIYMVVLTFFSWLFSIWWFMVLLLFFGIYLFLKLLFKIFGGRN